MFSQMATSSDNSSISVSLCYSQLLINNNIFKLILVNKKTEGRTNQDLTVSLRELPPTLTKQSPLLAKKMTMNVFL